MESKIEGIADSTEEFNNIMSEKLVQAYQENEDLIEQLGESFANEAQLALNEDLDCEEECLAQCWETNGHTFDRSYEYGVENVGGCIIEGCCVTNSAFDIEYTRGNSIVPESDVSLI